VTTASTKSQGVGQPDSVEGLDLTRAIPLWNRQMDPAKLGEEVTTYLQQAPWG
jgi:hypothetical protein